MNNSSLDAYWDELPLNILYIVEFLTIGVGNIILTTCILRYKALRNRKEYLILLGLFLADSINLFGYFAAGLLRVNLFISHDQFNLSTILQCAKTPHAVLWSFSEYLSALMLVIVALDRLIAVWLPLSYRNFGINYGVCVISCAYLSAFVKASIYYGFVVFNENLNETMTDAMCYASSITKDANQIHHVWHMYNSAFNAAFSVLLYGLVLVVHWCKGKGHTVQSQTRQQKRQKRLTMSLGISSLCTLVFSVIPIALGYTIHLIEGPHFLEISFFVFCNFNPLCNIIIYLNRHQELRQAVVATFKCKRMPENLGAWKRNARAQEMKNITAGVPRQSITELNVVQLQPRTDELCNIETVEMRHVATATDANELCVREVMADEPFHEQPSTVENNDRTIVSCEHSDTASTATGQPHNHIVTEDVENSDSITIAGDRCAKAGTTPSTEVLDQLPFYPDSVVDLSDLVVPVDGELCDSSDEIVYIICDPSAADGDKIL